MEESFFSILPPNDELKLLFSSLELPKELENLSFSSYWSKESLGFGLRICFLSQLTQDWHLFMVKLRF